MKPLYFMQILLLTVSISGYAQIMNKEVKAKIETTEFENMLSVTGTAENVTDVHKSMRYRLTVIKKNKRSKNLSNNSQDGRFTLAPNEKKMLSKTQVNITKEDETILLLLLYDENDKIIGKDRIVVGEEDKADRPADGLELTGIVSDETKTKFGKEFYDYFYGKYQEKKLNARKIVKVEEELSFGRTTRIRVVIDNDLINEFVSRPDEDFLVYMAEESIARLIKYFQDVEKQKQYITQY